MLNKLGEIYGVTAGAIKGKRIRESMENVHPEYVDMRNSSV